VNPDPPDDVRFVYADDPDREVPVEVVYLCEEIERVTGRLERLHVWLALNPREDDPVAIRTRTLPAHTAVRVGWTP
jgi:hypothetical protein